jgi:hypothetical protein
VWAQSPSSIRNEGLPHAWGSEDERIGGLGGLEMGMHGAIRGEALAVLRRMA